MTLGCWKLCVLKSDMLSVLAVLPLCPQYYMGKGLNLTILPQYLGQNVLESSGDRDQACSTTEVMGLGFSSTCACMHCQLHTAHQVVCASSHFDSSWFHLFIFKCCVICNLTCASRCGMHKAAGMRMGWRRITLSSASG